MQADHCVFVKKFNGSDFLIVLLYVDDMLIVRRDPKKIGNVEEGSEQVLPDEEHGTGEVDSRDAHSPRSDEEAIVAVTREVRCRVVTRVRGEQGGTTGALDGGVGEKGGRERERRSRTRTDTEARRKHNSQHNKYKTISRQSI